MERCPVCGGAGRPFYCPDCVRAGRFRRHFGPHGGLSPVDVPGTASRTRDTWADDRFTGYDLKLLQWNDTRQKGVQLSARFAEMISGHHRYIQKITELEESRNRNRLLKMAIRNTTKKVVQGLSELDAIREMNCTTLENSLASRNETIEAIALLQTYQNCFEHASKRLARKNVKILSWRLKHIRHLIKYIFPIEVVWQSDSDASTKARVSLLAEARDTAYVKGHWIRGHSKWEERYRVIESILPGNGDYNLYNVLGAELPQYNELWNIMAGLCYTTHLVHQLAFYLGVCLPWDLHYREFCAGDLTKTQLNTAVFKLNCDILHLCYTQNVNLEGIHPQHTICNLLVLLNHPDLGKSIVSSDAESIDAIEDCLHNGSGSLDLLDSLEKADAAEKEWEHVPATLPEQSQSCTTVQETRSTVTSIASGLVSSAIFSIWRGWGKADK